MTDNIKKILKRLWLAATALFAVGSLATVIYYIIYNLYNMQLSMCELNLINKKKLST